MATDAPVGGIDVEFTKIEQLDAGDPTKNLAPAYRVWFHNNSDVDINQPFDVAILASNDDRLVARLALCERSGRWHGCRRNHLGRHPTADRGDERWGAPTAQTAAFAYVHTIIDSQKELVETNKANNLSVDSRDDIPAAADDQQANENCFESEDEAHDGRQFQRELTGRLCFGPGAGLAARGEL